MIKNQESKAEWLFAKYKVDDAITEKQPSVGLGIKRSTVDPYTKHEPKIETAHAPTTGTTFMAFYIDEHHERIIIDAVLFVRHKASTKQTATGQNARRIIV